MSSRHERAILGWVVLAFAALGVALWMIVTHLTDPPSLFTSRPGITLVTALTVSGIACWGGLAECMRHAPQDRL